jgi:hypothetical protein
VILVIVAGLTWFVWKRFIAPRWGEARRSGARNARIGTGDGSEATRTGRRVDQLED